ncbi:hypothetical protein K1T71_013594 [Dendrolimus kikuchii]|uniref:Uncharacterized protein n=1 Tax=Dendrolimus kikuchii TaxID=765133 RepID=A0ACC1CGY6_9NEOP|nr:hypothetical protein K1T71_013594 [Dendrolimus kikuchii]
MTEADIGFLYKLATSTRQLGKNDPRTLLRSYYMMRCKEFTRGYGLPGKQFSNKARCPRCCLEWPRNTEVKVKSIKLSKRQKKRIKSKKVNNFNRFHVESRKNLLHSNEMVQICSFCAHSTVTQLLKPAKERCARNKENNNVESNKSEIVKEKDSQENIKGKKAGNKKNKLENEKVINVYTNAFDIFSMKNEKNTLKHTIKEPPKIIKNNKKKKDKFAGLNQKAVLASAKIKEEKEKSNKLNLFLKPSS